MKKAIILYILLLVTVTGCIKENLDDCETTLYFSYLGDGTKEIFPQKIEKVDMYIYNQTNDSLYFGEREITIVNESYKVDTVYFSSAHIKMQIELEGLDVGSTRAATSPVSIEMGKLSSTVDFTKTFSNERVSYFPLVTFDSNVQKFGSKFNVLRFNDDNEVYLRLRDLQSNEELYTMQLKDFMKDNNITVNGINEAAVGIRIYFNGTAITVKPWDEEVIRPGI